MEGAQIPFDNILDRVTGSDPSVADYILQEPAKCPNCQREILEKTWLNPSNADEVNTSSFLAS
jgi:hypothetical protein